MHRRVSDISHQITVAVLTPDEGGLSLSSVDCGSARGGYLYNTVNNNERGCGKSKIKGAVGAAIVKALFRPFQP